MIIIGLILFVALFWGVPELDRLIRRDRISRVVKHCCNTDTITLRRDCFYLSKRYTENISEKYQISDSDIQSIDIIIDGFRDDITKKFCANKLKSFLTNNENCFLLYLREYMVQNQYEMSIGDHEIYKHQNSTNVVHKFAITDFGISFYKVLCLLHLWYVDYKKINNPESSVLSDIKDIKKCIDDGFLITYN